MRGRGAWLLAAVLLCVPIGAAAETAPAAPHAILDAMESELARSRHDLVLEDFERPYFIAYSLRQREQHGLLVTFGSLFRATHQQDAELSVSVRVGSYAFDNTGTREGGMGFLFDEGLPVSTQAPLDGNLTALRSALWLLTDQQYKAALNQYHQKRGQDVYERRETTRASFSRETPVRAEGPSRPFSFDEAAWRRRLVALSERFKAHPAILQHRLSLNAERQKRFLVTSEGTRLLDERVLFSVMVEAETRAAKDDMVITDSRAFYAPSEGEMAATEEMARGVDGLITELEALREAPLVDPYSGPAILSSEATAVLMHEAVGHRLEGDRQNNDDEGHTYKGHIGMQVLPTFLDLIDDPTRRDFEGVPLNGTYLYDEEGVPAQKVTLIEGGILKNFLLSRTPIEADSHSNGHGRAMGGRVPQARMANTLLVSHRQVPMAELKARLLELVKEQGKPYGLLIEDMEGGSTNTSSYGYQAFKGVPRIVKRLYPDGREEWVRGVELVGTPLASINKIVLTSDAARVFNGFCGAESGYVPVSSTAPAVLLSELELQRKKEEKSRPPVLPSPFSSPKKE